MSRGTQLLSVKGNIKAKKTNYETSKPTCDKGICLSDQKKNVVPFSPSKEYETAFEI